MRERWSERQKARVCETRFAIIDQHQILLDKSFSLTRMEQQRQRAPRLVSKKQLRKLAVSDPAAFWARIKGSRARELTARHLLLNQGEIAAASPEDIVALQDYVSRQGWRSLYMHDRGMYLLLRNGAREYLKSHRSG